MRTDKLTDITKLTHSYRNSSNAHINSYNPSFLHILCSRNTFVYAADISCFSTVSIWWANCETEWIICINVITGWFLCRKGIIIIYVSFTVYIYSVHKNVNQFVSLYLQLTINTQLSIHQYCLEEPNDTQRSPLYQQVCSC
jgi:hypothetical protein